MNSKPVLSVSDVQAILTAAQGHAVAKRWPVTIAVADDGGHLLGLIRLDGAAPLTALIAQAKARTAAMARRDSKHYEDAINHGRYSLLSVPTVDGLLEGGVRIIIEGQIIGGVGVSGVKSFEDAQIARAGIAALGSSAGSPA